MNRLRRSATAALVALVLARVDVPNAHATPIDWVTVGDPGNAADTTTYGAVGYEYQIMKLESLFVTHTSFARMFTLPSPVRGNAA